MGLAASQARFLTLTARKSNIEFQGQQINQNRTVLANKSADVVNKMLALKPPVPPTSSSGNYYKVAQNLVNKTETNLDGTAQSEKIKSWKLVSADGSAITSATTDFRYEVEYTYLQGGQTMTAQMYTPFVTVAAGTTNQTLAATQLATDGIFQLDDATGNIVKNMIIDKDATAITSGSSVLAADADTYNASDLIYGTSFDDASYNEAMNLYDFDKYTYEKAISDINGETSQIQSKDKALELKLKQLDSEHGAISTELEAVKNVITKNIESTFKTFS